MSAKILKLLTSPEEDFEDLSIGDYFGKDSALFKGNFWLCLHTMLAFKPWHSVMELRRAAGVPGIWRYLLDRGPFRISGILANRPAALRTSGSPFVSASSPLERP